jgi:hypothetical protein
MIRELWDEIASGTARCVCRRCCGSPARRPRKLSISSTAPGGGTSLYGSGRLERCFRDVHACTQHIATSIDSYEVGGRVLLGLDPGRTQF